jgi:hypothetical protein
VILVGLKLAEHTPRLFVVRLFQDPDVMGVQDGPQVSQLRKKWHAINPDARPLDGAEMHRIEGHMNASHANRNTRNIQ